MKKILFLMLLAIPSVCMADAYDKQYYRSVIDTNTCLNDRHLRGSYYIGTSSATNDANIYLGYDGRIKSQFAGTYVAPSGLVEISTGTGSYSLYVSTNRVSVGIGTNAPASGVELDVNGDIKSTTLDTGQSAGELYGMNQYVNTNSSPTFARITTSDDVNVGDDVILSTGGKVYLNSNTYIYKNGDTETRFYNNGNLAFSVLNQDLILQATKGLYFDGYDGTYIYESAANTIKIVCGAGVKLELGSDIWLYDHTLPSVTDGSLNLGNASQYWGDVSYKTLTDRGCLGYFDDGVEMPNGSIVSDTEALLAIKKHPTKKTIYGADMLDYKSFPKVAYKKAEIDGKLLNRDINNEPIGGQDGIEMTSMFSIMIGAIRELAIERKSIKAQNVELESRIKALEDKQTIAELPKVAGMIGTGLAGLGALGYAYSRRKVKK